MDVLSIVRSIRALLLFTACYASAKIHYFLFFRRRPKQASLVCSYLLSHGVDVARVERYMFFNICQCIKLVVLLKTDGTLCIRVFQSILFTSNCCFLPCQNRFSSASPSRLTVTSCSDFQPNLKNNSFLRCL